ncbi:MAG: hypothetical protein ABIN61_05595 [candidate division WOR-3 bacterium]
MKKFLNILLLISVMTIYPLPSYPDIRRDIKVNNVWMKVVASGRQTEATNRMSVAYAKVDEDFWEIVHCFALVLGVVNWQGPDSLVADPEGRRIRLAGAPFGEYEKIEALGKMFPRVKEGTMIRRYYRYKIPEVVVDGIHLEPPKMSGDEINPDYIKNFSGNNNCTADLIVESSIGTWLGLDIRARYLVWTGKNHDDYIIYDWVFVNTGNINEDPEIELPGQTLDSLYIMRQAQFMPVEVSWGSNSWTDWWGVTPEQLDSMPLRAQFWYPIPTPGGVMRGTWALGFSLAQCFGEYDRGYIDESANICVATIFAPKTKDGLHPVEEQFPNNPASDDSTQPRSNSNCFCNDYAFKYHSGERPKSEWITVYNVMKYGQTVNPDPLYDNDVYLMQDIPPSDPMHYWIGEPFPNTYHNVPSIDLPGSHPTEISWYQVWHAPAQASFGPYRLELGDSLRLVQVLSLGGLDARTSYEIGQKWLAGTLRYDGPRKCPHKWYEYPEIWHGSPVNDSATLAKDEWIFSVLDSVKHNALRAQWNFDNGYSAPVPPPPPEFFYVNSRPEYIELSWGSQSEEAPDFTGYRIYRALGNPGPTYSNAGFIGEWKLIYQCGGKDPGGEVIYSPIIEHSFKDSTALKGQNYYYYITAFDKGGESDFGELTESLESSKWLTRTTFSTTLCPPAAENLDSVLVVPNPYSMRAGDLGLQYSGEEGKYKLMFLNLPPVCTIRIYNETGDLIKTIEHTNGSGGEAWSDPTHQTFLTTDSGQMVVSGLYIAHITTPQGQSKNVKFVIVR